MRIGDVKLEPQRKRVHVVYELHDGGACATLAVSQAELARWTETPEELRLFTTVELERHDKRDMRWWRKVEQTVERMARLYAFADVHVSVLPRG